MTHHLILFVALFTVPAAIGAEITRCAITSDILGVEADLSSVICTDDLT
ncbi:hypothetical protein [Nitrosospira sp. NRS527]|nr:hypothetical protein [Nitrosospira sp. NRS527]BCT67426.1 hypothetical protein NNRS527_01010 [Nitrosospira sp. NRS527]